MSEYKMAPQEIEDGRGAAPRPARERRDTRPARAGRLPDPILAGQFLAAVAEWLEGRRVAAETDGKNADEIIAVRSTV